MNFVSGIGKRSFLCDTLLCISVCLLFRDGIRFAFRDPEEGEDRLPNVAFLEILHEFSYKLLQADRAQL